MGSFVFQKQQMHRLTLWFYALLLSFISLSECAAQSSKAYPISRENLYIRDPFVLVDEKNQTYYMYASREYPNSDGSMRPGVGVHTSKDLINWSIGYPVYEPTSKSWANKLVWAPEVHQLNGKYYLFVTLTSHNKLAPAEEGKQPQEERGTQILVADSPIGPFKPFVNEPAISKKVMTLDGTLWVEDGQPWMIYCHEWAQITDGKIELVKLKKDLSGTIGKPTTLFQATDADWVVSLKDYSKGKHPHGYITDGPWIHRTQSGDLLMIWSSFSNTGYSIGIAQSESRTIKGPWKQQKHPLINQNGGHGMIFKGLDKQLYLTLHHPNDHKNARAQFIPIDDNGRTIALTHPFKPKQ